MEDDLRVGRLGTRPPPPSGRRGTREYSWSTPGPPPADEFTLPPVSKHLPSFWTSPVLSFFFFGSVCPSTCVTPSGGCSPLGDLPCVAGAGGPSLVLPPASTILVPPYKPDKTPLTLVPGVGPGSIRLRPLYAGVTIHREPSRRPLITGGRGGFVCVCVRAQRGKSQRIPSRPGNRLRASPFFYDSFVSGL